MKQQNRENKKMIHEERERLDNKIVLATAIALVGAMVMVFLYNWFVSIYARQTKVLIDILMWLGIAGVAAFLVLFFVKKECKFLFVMPYFAVGALFMREIMAGTVTTLLVQILSKIPFLKMGGYTAATTAQRFNFIYICLAVYLVASYIYYGIKIKKLGK